MLGWRPYRRARGRKFEETRSLPAQIPSTTRVVRVWPDMPTFLYFPSTARMSSSTGIANLEVPTVKSDKNVVTTTYESTSFTLASNCSLVAGFHKVCQPVGGGGDSGLCCGTVELKSSTIVGYISVYQLGLRCQAGWSFRIRGYVHGLPSWNPTWPDTLTSSLPVCCRFLG